MRTRWFTPCKYNDYGRNRSLPPERTVDPATLIHRRDPDKAPAVSPAGTVWLRTVCGMVVRASEVDDEVSRCPDCAKVAAS